MNAGPDVERLIADWLVEEAPVRAPDRILGSAAQVIDRTRQRRFAAAWREPMTLSLGRMVAALAIVVIVVGGGAAWLGRSTAGDAGPAPAVSSPSAPTATASPTPSGATIQSYRDARDAVCEPLNAHLIQLNAGAADLHPDTTPSDLPASIEYFQQVVTNGEEAISGLAALTPPNAMAEEHAVDVTRHRDVLAILKEALAQLKAGKAAEALAIADAVEPLSGLEGAYEAKYGLAGCP